MFKKNSKAFYSHFLNLNKNVLRKQNSYFDMFSKKLLMDSQFLEKLF